MYKLLSIFISLNLVAGLCACTSVQHRIPEGNTAGATQISKDSLKGRIALLFTGDMHGRTDSEDGKMGYARIKGLKNSLTSQGAHVMLIDSGDFSQGNPIVNMDKGRTAIEFMNMTGYDLAGPGNHEFDWGTENLLENAKKASFPIICANIRKGNSPNTLFAPNHIAELGGVKFGFFALDTPQTTSASNPDKIKGLYFDEGERLYKTAAAQVKALKDKGCSVIVCIAHLGVDESSAPNRSIDIAQRVEGIDLILDGHSHSRIEGLKKNNTLIVSTGYYANAVAYIIIDVKNSPKGQTKVFTSGLYDKTSDLKTMLATGKRLALDSKVNTAVETKNNALKQELSKVFASSKVFLNGERDPGLRTEETNLGDFSTDAMLYVARKAAGQDRVDAAIINGGAVRASIKEGNITMMDMNTVFPFGNTVKLIHITGAELLEALEASYQACPQAIGGFAQISGIELTLRTSVAFKNAGYYPGTSYYKPANPGSRVTIKSVNGKPFNKNATYAIATTDFLVAGGDTFHAFKRAGQSAIMLDIPLDEALVTYTSEVLNGVVGPEYAKTAGRIVIVK